ncbi:MULTISPECIES: DUF2271 domain-containing protein [Nitrincola]|nr:MULTISPECIES: DUF2271 domain-containing protein [Nitrincola]EXJ09581.1 flagellar basal body rod modification protein [Nitrincola nitratireducens]
MKSKWVLGVCLVSGLAFNSHAQPVDIEVTIPAIAGPMYYRPYVAIWVENDQEETVRTIEVWRKEPDWLKDMRRWWRKAGRYDQGELDAVTGATKRPGTYTVTWDGVDQKGQPVPAGTYYINVEAAREHGNRSWVRGAVELGVANQRIVIDPTEELGEIILSTGDAK